MAKGLIFRFLFYFIARKFRLSKFLGKQIVRRQKCMFKDLWLISLLFYLLNIQINRTSRQESTKISINENSLRLNLRLNEVLP